jgi:hypothetical protein
LGVILEGFEGGDQSLVALIDGAVEAVVGRGFLGDLPNALDAVQLGGVSSASE